jgi:hypothetical protein
MDLLLGTLVGLFVLGLLYVALPFTVDVYRRFNYRKVVKCPETGQLTEVKPNALWAALTANFRKPSLRVRDCSLWPKREGCAEKCVKENWPTY